MHLTRARQRERSLSGHTDGFRTEGHTGGNFRNVPAYKRQKSYLLAGILIDDISNYALLYNVHAIKKNGELHRGMDGFCQAKKYGAGAAYSTF